MKLTAILAVLMCAAAAYAGPYLIIEQSPVDVKAELVVGWDFVGLRLNDTLAMAGDFFFANRNLWVYPSPLTFGSGVSLSWFNAEVRTLLLAIDTEIDVLPAGWPGFIGLDAWSTTIELRAMPSYVVDIYAKVAFVYDALGLWSFNPVVGIECRW